MLIIRLSRVGKKKQYSFRVIISEKTKDTVGDYLELLGNYNPHTNKATLKADRIKYWLSKGAQVSGSVHNLLVESKIIQVEKIKVANIKKKAATPTAAPAPAEKKAESKAEEKKKEPKTEAKAEEKKIIN